MERTCDRVAIIKQGRLVSAMGTDELRHARQKVYKLELADDRQFAAFRAEPLAFAELRPDKRQAKVAVRDEDINAFIRLLSGSAVSLRGQADARGCFPGVLRR